MDNVIKMHLALFGTVLLTAFLVFIARTVAACIVFPEKHMNALVSIFVVAIAVIELFILVICFAEYLIGG